MRKYINLVQKLNEGEVVPFPGNPRPISNMAVARGGADVVGYPGQVPLDDFQQAYVTAALWSSTDDEGEPLDRAYEIDDIATPTRQQMADDCDDFRTANAQLLDQAYEGGYSEEQAGHDFWLTRNGHGAGFWDRGLGEVGQALTKSSKVFGEFDLYVGDDKMIHGE